jgi:hypothetical protein
LSTFQIPLKTVIEQYAPVYPHGGTWEDTKNYLLSNPIDAAIVARLVEILLGNGEFREPIRLDVGIDDDDNEYPIIGNGTHRVCASMIARAETILAITAEDAKKLSGNPTHYVETLVVFSGEITEEDDDLIVDAMRSFEADSGVWFEMTTCSYHSSRNEFVFMWDNDPEEVEIADLERNISQRLASFGYAERIIKMRTTVEAYDF